ncbi:MAG: hypothetical protein WBP79_13155 [Candidatus Acidiferrales bacterium]
MSKPYLIASLILGLGDANPSVRENAAAEIFRMGREMARDVATIWLTEPELAGCFALGASHFPETTVGVAVQPEQFERIHTANGSPRLAEVPPDQDAGEFELHFPENQRLDILTTRQPGGAGAIARFLAKFGEGIQQVEFLTINVDRATQILQKRFDLAPVYPETRAGADGTRVNFFLVPSPQGDKVLVELVEEKRESQA